jgi:signal transduction histidine kinase
MPVKRMLLFICIVLSIFGIFTYSASQNKNVPSLQANKGQITADGSELLSSPFLLTGEWRIYPGLYSPSELDARPYYFVDDIQYMHKLAGATYTLELNGTNMDGYRIMMPEPNGCRLWIDGEEVTSGNNKNVLNDNTFALHVGDSALTKIQIVFQVSASGGTKWNYQGLILGTERQLEKVQVDFLVQTVIQIGILAMLFVHAITLFLQKRSEGYLLLLAAVALISFIITLNTTPYIRSNWDMFVIPLPDYLRPVFTEFLGALRNIFIIAILIRLFPQALSQKFKIVFNYSAAFYLSLSLFSFFPQVLVHIDSLLSLLSWIFVIISGWIILFGFFRNYTGSTILLIGFCIYVGARLFFNLVSLGIIPHHAIFLPLVQNLRNALMLYSVAIASAINGRFAQKYSQADDLAANLERKVIEKTAAIQASQDQIILMQQQKRELTTGIVHNLNTSLFTLGGYVEILKDEFLIESPEARQYLDRINDKVEYVQKMAADMFLMAKLDDGQIRLDQEVFDLVALCRQIIRDASMEDGGKHLKFYVECSVETAYFSGDRFYLQQAIENILSNAIRNSNDKGKISISITVVNDMYHLAISDNGVGISPEELPRVFERYYTKKKDGYATTGLGLSIAQEIVHQLGGSILAESSLGEGAVFTIQLPISRVFHDN